MHEDWKRNGLKQLSLVVGAAALLAAAHAWADTKLNNYHAIVDQNIFRLRPILPITPSVAALPAKEEKVPYVELTGIITLFPQERILVEISDAPNKPPSRKPIMRVGDREEGIELLGIDVKNCQATMRIGNVTTNLTLRAPKAAPVAPPPTGRAPPIPAFTASGAPPGPPVAHLGSDGRSPGVVVAGGDSRLVNHASEYQMNRSDRNRMTLPPAPPAPAVR